MFDQLYYKERGLGPIYDKVCRGERLTREDGNTLFNCPDLLAVGSLAHHSRLRRHGLKTFFVRNRHINYSNICVNSCSFCAYRREQGQAGAFTLGKEEIIEKVLDDQGMPFREIHMVGGCHPALPLEWFEDVFRTLKSLRPDSTLKAFTVVEIAHLAAISGCTTREVLARLKKSGLSMLTGGGAEIFDPSVRSRICPEKISGAEYLRIAGEAHQEGLKSNCSMLFGHVESYANRVDHLVALREQQDISGGFVCFIPLPFLDENNPLASREKQAGRFPDVDSGLDRLRTIAVARLMLDNIPHIKAYWVMLGIKLAQAALCFGADDLDGTIEEERIGHMAGARSSQSIGRHELEAMIFGCGFRPVDRDALFQESPGGPARSTNTHRASKREHEDLPCGAIHAEPPDFPTGIPPMRLALSRDPLTRKSAEVETCIQRLTGAYSGSRQNGEELCGKSAEARLSFDEALMLYAESDLFSLGSLANLARLHLHPEPVVTYVGDRNINYSNVCVCGCRFCAFFRPPGHPSGFILTKEELRRKIDETLRLGGTQILLQGGHHPDLPLEFYEEMIGWIRDNFPSIHIHAFSPPEIVFFAKKAGLSVSEVIARLIRSGLASIPGGGAEILVDRVRSLASPNKCSSKDWLNVMEEAHAQGLKTTATMMFGHLETDRERLGHLFALRELQDKTHGFTAFIPWTFQPGNTDLECRPETAQAYLRVLSMARLVLDNIPNIQSSWVTMGPQLAQVSLFFGANDFGSLMIEENVVAAAGTSHRLSREQIESIIGQSGFTPRQRYMDYTLLN